MNRRGFLKRLGTGVIASSLPIGLLGNIIEKKALPIPRVTGGIFEQIKTSNINYYENLNVKMIEEVLTSISKQENKKEREFKVYTNGRYLNFSDWVV